LAKTLLKLQGYLARSEFVNSVHKKLNDLIYEQCFHVEQLKKYGILCRYGFQ
jgi:hypothetical protein